MNGQILSSWRALGVRIRKYRETMGLSQLAFAARAKVTQAHLCHAESGKVNMTLSKFADVCKALGVKPSDLLKEVGL